MMVSATKQKGAKLIQGRTKLNNLPRLPIYLISIAIVWVTPTRVSFSMLSHGIRLRGCSARKNAQGLCASAKTEFSRTNRPGTID